MFCSVSLQHYRHNTDFNNLHIIKSIQLMFKLKLSFFDKKAQIELHSKTISSLDVFDRSESIMQIKLPHSNGQKTAYVCRTKRTSIPWDAAEIRIEEFSLRALTSKLGQTIFKNGIIASFTPNSWWCCWWWRDVALLFQFTNNCFNGCSIRIGKRENKILI